MNSRSDTRSPSTTKKKADPIANPIAISRGSSSKRTHKQRSAEKGVLPIHRGRLRFILLLFIAFVGYIVYSLAMHSSNEALANEARQRWTNDTPILAKRGDILDRNGRQLATSVDTETIVVRPSRIENATYFAECLAPILDMSSAEIYEKLTLPKDTLYLKSQVGPVVAAQVMSLARELGEESGVNIFKEPRRYYPRGDLAATVLGIAGRQNEGLEGIELTYDAQLGGVSGRYVREQATSGQQIPDTPAHTLLPQNGYSVVLTIDERIQHLTEVIVEAYGIENKAERYSAMVMNPNTGDILAMATYPRFDPNNHTFSNPNFVEDPELRRNRFVTDAFEPGSTFKLITALAGLEEGIVTEDELIEDPGYIVVNGVILRNWEGGVDHGWETFRDGMRNSCNVILAKIGQRLGADKLVEYQRLMGFGEYSDIDFPGETPGILFDPEEMGPLELATSAFGQGPAVTPLQQVLAVSAIANGGKLMQPRLVMELRDQQNKLVQSFDPIKRRDVASASTMQRMRDLMEYIINAPGSKGASTEYRLAGKTGTANKLNPATGSYYDDQFICSTIGFAPADNPLYTIYIYADNPQGPNGYYGGQVAAPAFRQLADSLLKSIANLPPQLSGETIQNHLPSNIYAHEMPSLLHSSVEAANTELEALSLKVDLRGEGEQVLVQFPAPKTSISPGQMVTLYLGDPSSHDAGEIVIPDFSDKTIVEVTNVSGQLNLSLRPQGQSGLCYSQQPEAGSIVTKGTILTVWFR